MSSADERERNHIPFPRERDKQETSELETSVPENVEPEGFASVLENSIAQSVTDNRDVTACLLFPAECNVPFSVENSIIQGQGSESERLLEHAANCQFQNSEANSLSQQDSFGMCLASASVTPRATQELTPSTAEELKPWAAEELTPLAEQELIPRAAEESVPFLDQVSAAVPTSTAEGVGAGVPGSSPVLFSADVPFIAPHDQSASAPANHIDEQQHEHSQVIQAEVRDLPSSELATTACGDDRFSEDEIMDFMHAAEKGDVKRLAWFLDFGINVEVLSPQPDIRSCLYSGKGDTVLVKACRDDQMDAMKLLIERGANVNAKTGDNMRQTALHVAVEERSIPRARFLLNQGANPNATNHSGSIPLMSATKRHQPELVQLLLEYSSDPNHQDDFGRTALHWCFEVYYGMRGEIPHLVRSSITCAGLLVEAGADMDIFSFDLETPLVMAVRRFNTQGARFLLTQNCDPDLPAGAHAFSQVLTGPVFTPFRAAAATKDLSLAKGLVLAGCRLEDCSDLDLPEDFKGSIRQLVSEPRSLMENCRLVLRRMMRHCGGVGSKQTGVVEALQLPTALKDFILLKDLKPYACCIM